MKRLFASILTLCLCLAVLTACAKNPGGASAGSGGSGTEPPFSDGDLEAAATLLCRIVDGAEEGALLLAGQGEGLYGGGGSDVYALQATELPVILDGASASVEELRNGMLVEVSYSGNVMETFPAQLADVTALSAQSDGFDDRCALYVQVLEDLWNVDSGLNSDITELGVDLSGTRLSLAEQSAVAWAFGQKHGLAPVLGTYEELVEQGYITGEPLEDSDAKFYQWENGCLFSISEQEAEGESSLAAVTFDAEKWRSGLGAYYFIDCTSVQSAQGAWDGYHVGTEAIS